MGLSNRFVIQALHRIQWIIILLIGCVFVGSLPTLWGAKEKWNRAQAEVQALAVACEQYKLDNGDYPTSSDFLNGNNPRKIQYVIFKKDSYNSKGELVDAWGTPFRISSDESGVLVVSAGKDRTFETKDDITNRK